CESLPTRFFLAYRILGVFLALQRGPMLRSDYLDTDESGSDRLFRSTYYCTLQCALLSKCSLKIRQAFGNLSFKLWSVD
ncbi:MAG TPA: hypothetical protein VFQ43_05580, partial [Nitrososphaera sp.]|nr:hypothetical protein [Nitrososphaera sp.]